MIIKRNLKLLKVVGNLNETHAFLDIMSEIKINLILFTFFQSCLVRVLG